MSGLIITKVIGSEEAASRETVITKIEEALKKECDKVKIKKTKDGEPKLYCRFKGELLNPIVSIKGPIKIQTEDKKVKVIIDVHTKINRSFWFPLIIGLIFWPILLLMLYSAQKKFSIQSFEKIFEQMDFDRSEFLRGFEDD